MSGHVEVTGERDWSAILIEAATLLREQFGIAHVTLQPEEAGAVPDAFRGCSLDTAAGRLACCVPLRRREASHHRHRQ
jgi:cobalt-zinc-cadmium efflux system protein